MMPPIDPQRWDEIQATFEALVDLGPAERSTRLAALGVTDPALHAALESLLAADVGGLPRLARLDAAFFSAATPARDPLNLVGRAVSHFHVLEPLGAGGMGVVYRAEDTRLGRAVALKFLLPHYGLDPSAKERFLREAHSAAALDHPNLCTIHEVGESKEGHLFLAMALYPGETIKARLAREGPLTVGDALAITRQVAAGLACAHAAGIVHRDLKPGNVMLLPDRAVKLLDFGLAKARDESLSDTGARLGTVAYMAPEQIRGRTVDARADLWALGVVLYEMLTGQKPFGGEDAVAIAHAIVHDEPVSPSTLHDGLPAAVDHVVLALLQKDPRTRYATVAELITDLGEVGTLGDSAAPGLAARRLLTRHGRRAKRLGAAVVGMIALAALVAVWHPWRRPARAVAPEADIASVAVLPFDNLTGNASDQYLSDGMTEEVIGQLAQVRGLKVISRNSTEALTGGHLTPRQIAETLNVRHILEGSVRHAGTRIRVRVDLTDAVTDALVWASTYDRDLTDVFAVQEEIARHVADSLVSTVGVQPTLRRVPRTEQSGAYEAYLAGRSLMYRRTREALRNALARYQRAIEQDSTYAPAYAGLASSYHIWVVYNYGGIDPYDAFGRAVVSADRAIALDSDMALAYAARGFTMTFAWAPAETVSGDFQRALELQPNAATVHQWYAAFLSREGRHDEALAEAERSAALDPVAPGVRNGFAVNALAARRYDVASHEAGRALALEPTLSLSKRWQALGDLLTGHAARCATRSLGAYVGVRAMCLHSRGRVSEAEHIADSLRAAFGAGTASDSSFSPATIAQGLAEYYAWTGDAGESLAWLERAYAISPVGEDFRVMASGIYDKVRDDPRFRAGLQRARTQIYDRVRRVSRTSSRN